MYRLTDFFASRWSEFVEDTDNDEKRQIVLDAFYPTGLIRVDSHVRLMELHLLRLNVQHTACNGRPNPQRQTSTDNTQSELM